MDKKKIIIEPELLLSLYYGNEYSLNEIADIFECNGVTILRWMNRYDIPRRSISDAISKSDYLDNIRIVIDKNKLNDLYTDEKIGIYKIAKILNCSPATIYVKLKEYNIELREVGRRFWTDKEREEQSKRMLGNIPWNKDKKTGALSEEHRKKISNANKGHAPHNWSEESRKKMSETKKGKHPSPETEFGKLEKHPFWLDGKSFEPYGLDFNDELREKVRKRDNYTCQECGMTEDGLGYILSCHHIDYDKKNNSEDNLISLCKSCHGKTLYNRDNWTTYYYDLLHSRYEEK